MASTVQVQEIIQLLEWFQELRGKIDTNLEPRCRRYRINSWLVLFMKIPIFFVWVGLVTVLRPIIDIKPLPIFLVYVVFCEMSIDRLLTDKGDDIMFWKIVRMECVDYEARLNACLLKSALTQTQITREIEIVNAFRFMLQSENYTDWQKYLPPFESACILIPF